MENTPLSIQARKVRRKESFVRRADSSELSPSPHSSIYEAFYFSNNSSEENNIHNGVESVPLAALDDASNLPSSDENNFRYGRGTILETITEQKSIATLTTSTRTKSADDLSHQPFLSRHSSSLSSKVQRKQSFSLDDISSINRSYHEACRKLAAQSKSSLINDDALPVQEIYAQPRTPLSGPPERSPTPEGMPSWTAAQFLAPGARLSSANQPRRGNRFQRFLGIQPSETLPSATRSVYAPVRGGRAPRFRPPRSVYGQIDTHPFASAPVAKDTPNPASSPLPRSTERGPEQSVRFSAGAESSILSFHTALQTQSPPQPAQSISNSPRQLPQCPHRKGRLATLTAQRSNGDGNNRNNTQTETYMILPSEPSSAATSPTRPPRVCADRGSISVSVPSNPLSSPTHPAKEKRCWKCKVGVVTHIMDGWWDKSARFLCLHCCEVEMDEDGEGAARLMSVSDWDLEMGVDRRIRSAVPGRASRERN